MWPILALCLVVFTQAEQGDDAAAKTLPKTTVLEAGSGLPGINSGSRQFLSEPLPQNMYNVYNHDLQYQIPPRYPYGERQPGNNPQVIFGPSRESWPSDAHWQEGFSGGIDHRRLQDPWFHSHHGF